MENVLEKVWKMYGKNVEKVCENVLGKVWKCGKPIKKEIFQKIGTSAYLDAESQGVKIRPQFGLQNTD